MNQRKVVQASEILAKIELGEKVEYPGVIVEGDLDLRKLNLPAEHVERNEIEIEYFGLTDEVKFVKSQISITKSEIRGDLNLGNAVFLKTVSFEGTNFSKKADFVNAKFKRDANFKEAQFSEGANFFMAEFIENACFDEVQFDGFASFAESKFSGRDAKFWGAKFSGGDAHFSSAEFSGSVWFEEAVFSRGYTDFRWANFGGYTDFIGAVFSSGPAYFEEAVFSDEDIDFSGSAFGNDANFKCAKFSGYVSFHESVFSGDADFRMTVFSDDADFRSVEFSVDAKFMWAKFGGDANFIMARFGETVNFNAAKFGRSFITDWHDIKNHFKYDASLYPTLIKNYKDLSWFEDADDCYYHYRKARRARKPLKIRIPDIAAQVTHGYWVKPMFPLAWSAFFILVFGLIFLNVDGITTYSTQDIYENYNTSDSTMLIKTCRMGLVERPVLFLDYFLFSMDKFTSDFTSFLHPTEYEPKGISEYIAIFERLLGTFLVSFFFYAYGKTIRRGRSG